MVKKNIQDFYCNLVGEDVKIFLKQKYNPGLTYNKDFFVKCNQEDCQYVDENKSPCPLYTGLFSKPIPG